MEWGILVLRNFLDFSVKLRVGCLINMACGGKSGKANGVKYAKNTGSVNVGGELRRIETYLDMALCCKIVYLIGANLADDLHKTQGVTKVGIVEVEVGVSLEMSDALTKIY